MVEYRLRCRSGLRPTALMMALALAFPATRASSDVATPLSLQADALASANGGINPRNEADALHFIIAADRKVTCEEYAAAVPEISALPSHASTTAPSPRFASPCEMLRRAAESIQSEGAEFSYALRSLHPIDPRNGPQTEHEREGLQFVAQHPEAAYYSEETLGGRPYMTAIYADLRATASCLACHDPRSPKPLPRRPIAAPLGAIVIRVPLEF